MVLLLELLEKNIVHLYDLFNDEGNISLNLLRIQGIMLWWGVWGGGLYVFSTLEVDVFDGGPIDGRLRYSMVMFLLIHE